RQSRVAFVDEDHILIRGEPAQTYDVTGDVVEATGSAGSPLMTDPRGVFVITNVLRSCEGLHLRIVQRTQVVGGIVVGQSASEPLIVNEAPSSERPCSSTSKQK